jgi:hypothetical protein
MNPETAQEIIEADVVENSAPVSASRNLALRHPATPITLNDLASLKSDAIEVTRARVQSRVCCRGHPVDLVKKRSQGRKERRKEAGGGRMRVR